MEINEKSRNLEKEAFCISCSLELKSVNLILLHKDHDLKSMRDAIEFYQKKLLKGYENIDSYQKKTQIQIKKTENIIKSLKGQLLDAENELSFLQDKNESLSFISKDNIDKTINISTLLKWNQMFGFENTTKDWVYVENHYSCKENFITKVKDDEPSQSRFCVYVRPISQNTISYITYNVEKITGWAGVGLVTPKLTSLSNDIPWSGVNIGHGFYGISSNGIIWNTDDSLQNKSSSSLVKFSSKDQSLILNSF
jgi:hypothetical protein